MSSFFDRLRTLFGRENGEASNRSTRSILQVDAQQLHRLLQEPVPPLLLDVRDPGAKRTADLGGRNVPLWNVPQQLEDLRTWASRPVVVYCRSGSRSKQAVRLMHEHGIEEVYNLKGGLLSWTRHFGAPVPKR